MSDAYARGGEGAVWYREPWAWLVFGLPALVVAACLVTAWIAADGADDLVVDDYYKSGLAINQVMARDARAAALGLALEVSVRADGEVALALSAAPGFAHPPALDARFIHATRRSADREVKALHAGDGRYRGHTSPLALGAYYVELGTPEWRVVRRVHLR